MFIIATVSLLGWALIQPFVTRWMEVGLSPFPGVFDGSLHFVRDGKPVGVEHGRMGRLADGAIAGKGAEIVYTHRQRAGELASILGTHKGAIWNIHPTVSALSGVLGHFVEGTQRRTGYGGLSIWYPSFTALQGSYGV